MGTSTNGLIFYGVALEEDYEFPWSGDREGDIEEWWIYDVLGYKPSFEIYDASGEYIDGVKPDNDIISNYHGEKREFLKSNPLPIEIQNYCSGDYPMYAIAVKGTVIEACRGYPVTINPSDLVVTQEQRDTLVGFCARHNIIIEEPVWMLASYWG